MTLRRLALLALAPLVALADAPPAAPGPYVAVGYGGRRMSSSDGVAWADVQQWADKNADDSNNLMGLAYGKGKFVAVGGGGWSKETQAGHILTSADGKTWREVKKYPFRVNPVLFHAGRFVAGGPSRQLLWSDDGESWNESPAVTLPNEIPAWAFWFRKGAAGNGTFLFAGNAGKDQKIWWALSSKDGQTVTHLATDLPKIEGLTFGAGRFLLASPDAVLTSADGQKWDKQAAAPADTFSGAIWGGTAFYLTGKQGLYTSPDGVAWTKLAKAPPCSIVWADARGLIGTGWPGKMYFSDDGVTWKNAGQPLPGLGVNQVVAGDK